jgi:hypothetical protein
VDFAVANINGDNVSVFLNHHDGSGTFAPAVNYAAPAGPVDIVAGDVNGDGLPDLVVSDFRSNNVTVLLNDLANPGHFLPGVTYAVNGSPRDVRLADLNGDGFNDIITANYSTNTVSVLLNNGHGMFAPAQNYAAGPGATGAYSLAVADGLGDGRQDVAVGNFVAPNNGTVTFLRGNGDGTLRPYRVLAHLPGFASGLAAGDLTGNGLLDLVSSNNDLSGESVLLNDGHHHVTETDYASNQFAPLRVTLGDVNGDGHPDIVTDNFGTTNPGTVSILYGNGNGTFQAPQLLNPGGNQPSSVVVADVEGDSAVDGRGDLIVSNFASNNVSVLINTPAPLVASTTLMGNLNPPVSAADVVFTDPIDPNTFTADQFSLLDPNGAQVHVTSIMPSDGTNTRFHVTFDTQTTLGNYTLTIGPNIYDPTDRYRMPAPYVSHFTISNDVIVNGGFETGDFTGWTQSGDTSFTGVSSTVPVHSGTYAAFFGPTSSLGFISQTVATTPGQMYRLSLWLSHPFSDSGTEFRVQIGGTTVDDQVNPGNFAYTQFTYTYTATGTSTTIQLGFLEPPAYFYLDDVSFSPTTGPDVSSASLITAPVPQTGDVSNHVGTSATPAAVSSPVAPPTTSPVDQYFAKAPVDNRRLALASAGDDPTTVAAGLKDPLAP